MKKTTSKPRSTGKVKRATKKAVVARKRGLHHQVLHHTKRAYHATPKFVHGAMAGAFVGIVTVTSLGIGGSAGAAQLSSGRDCSDNAVLKCGGLTPEEVQRKYPQAGAATIYDYYGISAADIGNLHKTARVGKVYKDGRVTINGKVVATHAYSTGRKPINGSKAIVHRGVKFYESPNWSAFRPDYINAFVILKADNSFDFALLGPCSNPIKAKPVPVPKPPTPTPPTPTPPTPTPETPTPPPTPPAPEPEIPPIDTPAVLPEAPVVETVAEQPAALPKTGPAAALTVLGLAIAGGYLFHLMHNHHQRKRHHTRHSSHRGHHA